MMETLSTDAEPGVESELVNIGMLPLMALRPENSAALRAAMRDVVRRVGNAQVCEMRHDKDWIN